MHRIQCHMVKNFSGKKFGKYVAKDCRKFLGKDGELKFIPFDLM